MASILLPVDGSESSQRAARHLIYLIKTYTPLTVRVLNVQPPVKAGEISPMVAIEAIEQSRREDGVRDGQAIRALLDEAGIAYTYDVEMGPVAETIARYAKEHDVNAIIMGTRGLSPITNLLMGSIATRVLHLADVPVTLVK
jgi:nucleotide-binding universal stress UspA family protein